MAETKKVQFLYDQVEGTFLSSRTYDLDMSAIALTNELVELFPKGYRSFFAQYAEVITFTKSLKFKWAEDAPLSWRSLEKFWGMVSKGKDTKECFEFYKANLNNSILLHESKRSAKDKKTDDALPLIGWYGAMEIAHQIWVPKEWKLESELTPEELADPS